MRIKAGFVDVVEEGRHAIKIPLRNGIVFVVVAAGAAEGQPEERCARRGDSVGNILGAKFVIDTASFIGLAMQPVESRGDKLVARWREEQVTSDLPGDKLVVWKILIEGADNPIAPGGHVPVDVVLITV